MSTEAAPTLTWVGRTRTRPITAGTRLQIRRPSGPIVYGRCTGIGAKGGRSCLDVEVIDVYGTADAGAHTVVEGDTVWAYLDQVVYVH